MIPNQNQSQSNFWWPSYPHIGFYPQFSLLKNMRLSKRFRQKKIESSGAKIQKRATEKTRTTDCDETLLMFDSSNVNPTGTYRRHCGADCRTRSPLTAGCWRCSCGSCGGSASRTARTPPSPALARCCQSNRGASGEPEVWERRDWRVSTTGDRANTVLTVFNSQIIEKYNFIT